MGRRRDALEAPRHPWPAGRTRSGRTPPGGARPIAAPATGRWGRAPRRGRSSRRSRPARRGPARSPCRSRGTGPRRRCPRRRPAGQRRATPSQRVATRLRPAAEATRSRAACVDDRVRDVTDAPSTATIGPRMLRSICTEANGCNTMRLARPEPRRRRRGPGEPGHQRAVADDQVPARIGDLVDHERSLGEHQPVELDRRVRRHVERTWPRRRGAAACGWPTGRRCRPRCRVVPRP